MQQVQESQVQSLGWGDPLEKEMGTYTNYLLQDSCLEKSHGQRSLVGYSTWGCKELDMTECLSAAINHLPLDF